VPQGAVDPDLAAHQLDQRLADRQAQARAAIGRLAELSTWLKRWNSRPCCSTAMPTPVSTISNFSRSSMLAGLDDQAARIRPVR
jgi:hypothetical protein